MKKAENILLDSPLGKESAFSTNYDPTLLYPIPRTQGRQGTGIGSKLPFHGTDLWTSYELSWLNPKGKPIFMQAEFRVDCNSENIVESKSLKLYLNSFHSTRFASQEEVKETIEKDLKVVCGGKFSVKLLPSLHLGNQHLKEFKGTNLDPLDIETNSYDVNPSLLIANPNKVVEETLYSNLLRSNCPVTNQPDWATVYIHYAGKQIDHAGLLKYIISYRNHNGFHEQCVEKIFVDLMSRCIPEKLTVFARYTRRGGIDISPFRSNFETLDEVIL